MIHQPASGNEAARDAGDTGLEAAAAAAVDPCGVSVVPVPTGPEPLPQSPALEQSPPKELAIPDLASEWKRFLDWEDAVFERSFQEETSPRPARTTNAAHTTNAACTTDAARTTKAAEYSMCCSSQDQVNPGHLTTASEGFWIGPVSTRSEACIQPALMHSALMPSRTWPTTVAASSSDKLPVDGGQSSDSMLSPDSAPTKLLHKGSVVRVRDAVHTGLLLDNAAVNQDYISKMFGLYSEVPRSQLAQFIALQRRILQRRIQLAGGSTPPPHKYIGYSEVVSVTIKPGGLPVSPFAPAAAAALPLPSESPTALPCQDVLSPPAAW